MRAPSATPHDRSGVSFRGRNDEGRRIHRRFLNDSAFWFPPYLFPYDDYDYDYEYRPPPPAAPPVAAPPEASAPPQAPPIPAEPLLMENRGGQWVRIPTGSEIPVATLSTPSAKTEPPSGPNSSPGGYVELPAATAPRAPLPPAVIVFRDGHTEEVPKYMIQGQDLYTASDYYATGSWTRKIPLADLDIPASLRLNKERGTKFNLPSSPNEVMIRF